jgi:hypothetical protein
MDLIVGAGIGVYVIREAREILAEPREARETVEPGKSESG